MTRDQALRFHAELEALAGFGPGPNPDGRDRLKTILWQFDHDGDCDAYVREKAAEVVGRRRLGDVEDPELVPVIRHEYDCAAAHLA